jgi:hypothetical protein
VTVPQPGDASKTWESGLIEVLAAEAMDRSTFLGMPWISALAATFASKPPTSAPTGQFTLYTPLIDANNHLIKVDDGQFSNMPAFPGYLVVHGSIDWFGAGGGNSPHDHYANEFLAHTLAALKSGPEGTVLNAASFDEAAETFYNLWNWLNHAMEQVKSQLDLVGSDSSKFKGKAAGALLRTLENLHDEFNLLQKDLKSNQDWTEMLHNNASHIRQFWQELRTAWDEFYGKPEPTETVTNVVNQLMSQAQSVRLTDLNNWNVKVDVGDGTVRDFNILEWGAFGKLNTDMQTNWLNHAQALDSRMSSSYGSLQDSLDWTRTNMTDPHNYLPPPGDGVTTPSGGGDGNKNLDDILKNAGGGNKVPNLTGGGGGKVPNVSGGGGSGGNLPNIDGGGGGSLPNLGGGTPFTGPGGGNLDLSGGGGDSLDGFGGGGPVPALGGNDPAGGGLGPGGIPLLGGPTGNNARRTGGGSSTPTLPELDDFTGGGDVSDPAGTDNQPNPIDPNALGGGLNGLNAVPGLGGNNPDGSPVAPGGGASNNGFSVSPGAGSSDDGFSTTPGGGGSSELPTPSGGGSGFDLGPSHPLAPGSTNGFQLPASDLSGGGSSAPGGGFDSAWNPSAPPADSGFSLDPVGGSAGGGGAVGAPLGGGGDSRAGTMFGGLGPGDTALGGLSGAPAAAGLAGSPGAAGGMGGMPPMMPPMGGMGGNDQDKERERTTWLAEEEEVWGTDPDVAPSVIGRDDTAPEEQEDPRAPWVPGTRPPARAPARDDRRVTGRGY